LCLPVEKKPLRKYTEREQLQGTAPVGTETASNEGQPPAAGSVPATVVKSEPIVSPLEEMNKQSTKVSEVSKPAKSNSKPVKVAKKSK